MTNDEFIDYVDRELTPRPGSAITFVTKVIELFIGPTSYQDKQGYRWTRTPNGWKMLKEGEK